MISLAQLRFFTVNYLPLIVIITHFIDKYFKIPDKLFIIYPTAAGIFAAITLSAWSRLIPRKQFFNFNWRYEVAILYVIYFYVNWLLFYRKTKSIKNASLQATLSTIAVGWLYEVPLYLISPEWYRPFFYPTYPLVISSRLIALIFLIFTLKKLDWQFTPKTRNGIIVFLTFSLIWIFVLIPLPRRPIPFSLYRLPAMSLMTTLPIDTNGVTPQ